MLFNVRRCSIAALAAVLWLGAPLGARQEHQEAPRDQWQRPADVFEAMGLGPGSVVADLGAGGGWFTTRLARAVGAGGRVYAVDVNPISLRELRDALPKELTNIEIVRGEENDPKLPAGQLDAVLVVNAYHEFAEYAAVLARVRRSAQARRPPGVDRAGTSARRGYDARRANPPTHDRDGVGRGRTDAGRLRDRAQGSGVCFETRAPGAEWRHGQADGLAAGGPPTGRGPRAARRMLNRGQAPFFNICHNLIGDPNCGKC